MYHPECVPLVTDIEWLTCTHIILPYVLQIKGMIVKVYSIGYIPVKSCSKPQYKKDGVPYAITLMIWSATISQNQKHTLTNATLDCPGLL